MSHDLTAGTSRIDKRGIEQVYVPAGKFMMGSDPLKDPDAREDEQPAHLVRLTHNFWLDKYPVTNAAYQLFAEAGGYENPDLWTDAGWRWRTRKQNTHKLPVLEGFDAPNQPRVGLSRYEIIAYAKWRSAFLPTEAQWEYAARGPKSLIYPWGNKYDPARISDSQRDTPPTPVDRYPGGASWCGAFDMVGNISQATADWYGADYYQQKVRDDPQGAPFGLSGTRRKAYRGGRNFPDKSYTRAAVRFYSADFERVKTRSWSGFRLLVVVPDYPVPTELLQNYFNDPIYSARP